jgi:serine/threonine-protein kinase
LPERSGWTLLNAVLTSEQREGLDEDYQAFVARTGSADRDLFVQYLHQQGLLTAEQLTQALRLRGRIEVSELGVVLSEGASITYAETSPAGRYALLGRVGQGAMGTVAVGKDPVLKRKVAFKELAHGYARDATIRQRFLVEAQLTAQLDHPGVVPVYGLEIGSSGRLGYGMKLVEGRTLRELVTSERARVEAGEPVELSLADRIEVLLKVCDTVAYAHSRGVLHRDLKPDNIMVGAFGEVYVMDWGLARLMGAPEADGPDEPLGGAGAHQTQVGHAVGTPAYMSPEQARGENQELDGRSDSFALGLVLQEVATLHGCRKPSTAREALVVAARAERSPPVRVDGRALDRPLVAIIGRACAARRAERYQTVEALAHDLRCYLRGESVAALPEGPLAQLGRVLIRHREWVLVAGLLAVTLGSVLAVTGVAAFSAARLAQEHRDERISQAVTAVGGRAHQIDKAVLRTERTLEALASSATLLLTQGEPDPERTVYWADDFVAGRGPADLAASPRWGRVVSLSAPVVKLAPGVEPADVAPTVGKLLRLDRWLSEMPQRHDGPLGWTFIGTEDGVHLSWPGHGGYSADFDPRQRPWYVNARDRFDPVWGTPYVDINGMGLVVPCSVSLHGPDGALLGVAGMDMTLAYVIDELLVPEGVPVLEAWLVDGQGRVVVRTGDRATPPAERPLHPVSEVRERVTSGRAGAFRVDMGREDARWWMVFPLQALGWAYVVEADEHALLGG